MSQSPPRNILPKIRKVLPKNCVDIKYLPKASPLSYRNSMQGKNLIRKTDSCQKIEIKKKYSKTDQLRGSNEFNFVLLKLDVKDNSRGTCGTSVNTLKSRIFEKSQLKYYKSKLKARREVDSKGFEVKSSKIIKHLMCNLEEGTPSHASQQGLSNQKYSLLGSSRKILNSKYNNFQHTNPPLVADSKALLTQTDRQSNN